MVESGARENWERLLRAKWLVLGILFLVTGFLGLPLLWLSPSFSRMEKWIWSVVNVVYTSSLIYLTYRIVLWAWHSIQQSL